MDIEVLRQEFSVCKVRDIKDVDFNPDLVFVGKTNEEISLVCETKAVPTCAYVSEGGWRAFRVSGVLDFSLTGILYGISKIMADNNIGIFAGSTYNTDYILVKKENIDMAVKKLSEGGYRVKYSK